MGKLSREPYHRKCSWAAHWRSSSPGPWLWWALSLFKEGRKPSTSLGAAGTWFPGPPLCGLVLRSAGHHTMMTMDSHRLWSQEDA